MDDLCPTGIYGFSTDVSLCVSTCVWANVRRGKSGDVFETQQCACVGRCVPGKL